MSRKSKSSKSKADKQVKSGESTGRSAPADNERNTHANNEGGIAESSSSSDSDDIMPAEGSSTDKLVAVNVVDKGCTGTTAGLINLVCTLPGVGLSRFENFHSTDYGVLFGKQDVPGLLTLSSATAVMI